MGKYIKERLYLIVNGVEILITATPSQIIPLKEYLSELSIPKNGLYFKPSIDEFALIQRKLEEIIRKS